MTQTQDYRSIGYSSYRANEFESPEFFAEPATQTEEDVIERDPIMCRWQGGIYVRKLEEELAWARFEIAELKSQIEQVRKRF